MINIRLGFFGTITAVSCAVTLAFKKHPVFSLGAASVLGFAGLGVYDLGQRIAGQETTNAMSEITISKSRQDLIGSGVAGDKEAFQKLLSGKANEYFSSKGFPCDPAQPGKNIAETMAKARCENAPAP